MNSRRNRIVWAVVLAVMSGTLVVPTCLAATRKVIVPAATPLVSALDVLGTDAYGNPTRYDNWVTQLHDAIGAEADILVDQPATQRSVTIDLLAQNLIPGMRYLVAIDLNGYTGHDPDSIAGCIRAGTGEITAEEDGTFHFVWDSATLFSKGTYTFAVTINYGDFYPADYIIDNFGPGAYQSQYDIAKKWSKTILISAENFTFTIK